MIKLTIRGAAVLAASLGTVLGAQTFETLHQFNVTNGKGPETAMTVGPDGALYGTTLYGGAHDGGVIFRYDPDHAVPAERFTSIVDLNPATLGSFPVARLLNIGDGNLYGACKFGSAAGVNTGGTVFKIDPFDVVSVVHNFPAIAGTPYRAVYLGSGEPGVLHVVCEDNSGIRRVPLTTGVPSSALMTGTPKPQSMIRGSDGFLYGVTAEGGIRSDGDGILFRANADGTNFVTIHDFKFRDGAEPKGAMVQARDGNFYGVTTNGGLPGSNQVGVVYRLSKGAGDQYSYTVIHRFTDYDEAHGDLLLGSDGMLYGTCKMSGPGGNGNGGIWRIRTDGTGYKVLHTFLSGVGTGYPTGRNPIGGLVQGLDGHIYGTTTGGVGAGAGTIFRLKLNLPPPPENRAPIAVNDLGVTSGEAITVNVTANDFDPDGDGFFTEVQQLPAHGTAVLQSGGTILYTPDGTFAAAGSDQFTYEISDGRGGASIAQVNITNVAPPALFQPGGYHGLVSLDEELDGSNLQPRGQFQLTVQANRTFSGTLFAGKKRVPLRGTFNANGTATAKVVMPDRKSADVFLSFQAGNPSTIFAVFYGTEIWSGEAGPARTSGETKNLSYTVEVLANPGIINGPLGHGYATLTVKPTGAITAIGKLGDGSNLKWSSSLTELPTATRAIPVYSEPLKAGYISGLLFSSNNPGENFVGALSWFRKEADKLTKPYPLGFSGDVTARVARFIPPTGTNPVMVLPAGKVTVAGTAALPQPVSGTFTIDGKTIKSVLPLKAFTINRATGIFSGTIKNGTKSILFKGAINQGLGIGSGQFINAGATGSVVIDAPAG